MDWIDQIKAWWARQPSGRRWQMLPALFALLTLLASIIFNLL